MANHKSSKTRIRRNARRADINAARRGRMRTFVKKVEAAIAAGDALEAEQALRAAQPELARAASKSILHARTASRKLSRLSARIVKLKAAA
ncbi:MAG: 30S ribosomal protein S20 [Rhodospirillales bacterium]|nr:30S ribosomal protein S20 [Rhodospirillales bacterium]